MPELLTEPYPYDLKLAGKGYILAKGTNAWAESPLAFFPERIASTDISGALFPSEAEKPWTLSRFHYGYGEAIDPETPSNRYYFGSNVDCRIEGQVIPGPQVSSYSPGSTGQIRAFFELGSNLYCLAGQYCLKRVSDASWEESKNFGAGATPKDVAIFQGTQSTAFAFVALGTATTYWVFDGTTWTAATIANKNATTVRKTVDNGATYTDYTGGGTAAAILNALDTKANGDWLPIGFSAQFRGLGVDMNAANAVVATASIEYWNGTAWVSVGSITDGTASGGATLAKDGDITWTRPIDWQKNTIAGVEAYHILLSVSVALSATVSTTDINVIPSVYDDKAEAFQVVGDQLWRAYKEGNQWMVAACVDGGVTPTWGAGNVVGDSSAPVTKLFAVNNRLYVVKEDGLLGFVSGIAEDLLPGYHLRRDANNGIGMAVLGQQALIPLSQGLYSYSSSGSFSKVGPELLAGNDSVVRGRITAGALDDYYLYAVNQNEAGNSFLLSYGGYKVGADGYAYVPVWHGSLADLGAVTVKSMFVSSKPGPNLRLYIGKGSDIAWIILPRSSPNPRTDSNCLYATSATLYFPRFTANFPFISKALLAGAVLATNLASTRKVTFDYRIEDGGAWTTLGEFTADPGGRLETSPMIANTFLDMRVVLTGTAASPPVLKAVTTAYALRPPLKRKFTFVVRMADNIMLRNNTRDNRSEADYADDIAGAKTAVAVVSLVTPRGDNFDVMVPTYKITRLWDETTKRMEGRAEIVAVEYRVSYSLGTWESLSRYKWQTLQGFTWAQTANL